MTSDVHSLGYIRVQVSDPVAWRTFAFDVIGFAEGTGAPDGALRLRVDERPYRIELVPGGTDRVLAAGWEVRDHLALRRVAEALEAHGTPVKELDEAACAARGVQAGLAAEDPGGTPLEFFCGPALDHSPVVTPFAARFVTEGLGLGHVVVPVREADAAYAFYTDVLGFLPRGRMAVPLPPEAGGPLMVRFLSTSRRHHTLAVMGVPEAEPPGLVHLMVELETLDDVGRALDRVTAHGVPLSSTLGRHTNDKMVSFYVRTPGGWDLEVGCEGMLVDESDYVAEEITADSYWGHDWSVGRRGAADQQDSAGQQDAAGQQVSAGQQDAAGQRAGQQGQGLTWT
ncbi:VOC family protein [Streptomyces iconiensis]|uniref:VOC family protein n=1 Tax=Streptomyces iconiensis TaxID=1384038 RepID=A0ABT7A9S6_9ACTN|nr:VOC family protein [Streptomyces iconiensis]MDJ1138095.1 VOC family protein [Streptomyces iconiensis]